MTSRCAGTTFRAAWLTGVSSRSLSSRKSALKFDPATRWVLQGPGRSLSIITFAGLGGSQVTVKRWVKFAVALVGWLTANEGRGGILAQFANVLEHAKPLQLLR